MQIKLSNTSEINVRTLLIHNYKKPSSETVLIQNSKFKIQNYYPSSLIQNSKFKIQNYYPSSLIQNSKFKIQNYIILLLSLFIISCTTSPSSPKSSLSGSVQLSGAVDFSGVTIAVYNLAYLDTTIVRINTEYPHIGVIISQETEFDHRLQSPVKVTQTDASGNFKLTDIRPGKYNIAFLKEGYSLKYLYNVSLTEGDNTLPAETAKESKTIKVKSKISNDNQSNSKFKIQNSKLFNPLAFIIHYILHHLPSTRKVFSLRLYLSFRCS